ncbi:hypothetical protein D1614_20580 [Maribellus luteus]|uniref:Uncharacterized protein n=1 Tax=Maribellus luteus TaxID=2305463 RepID=A0A399SRC3_9BACT|nr:hypothetical protein D1614_20580 [Maribellus luteus]
MKCIVKQLSKNIFLVIFGKTKKRNRLLMKQLPPEKSEKVGLSTPMGVITQPANKDITRLVGFHIRYTQA